MSIIDPSSDPAANLTPHAAAALIIARRKARLSYSDFFRYYVYAAKANIQLNWHIDYLCDIMQSVDDRDPELARLIVNIPPRHLKSTILSQLWQAFKILRDDSRRSSLFSVSSSSTLAARDSRFTLDIIRSEWYRALKPGIELVKESETEWQLKSGAYRIACGISGTVTGRGADALIVDDAVSAQDGDSEIVREAANEFVGRSLRSRLDDPKTGTISIIMQRLHEGDLTGFLLEQSRQIGADNYKLICLPLEAPIYTTVQHNGKIYAERKPGDLLHPERMGAAEVVALKVSMRNNFAGQYLQNPIKLEGNHFDTRRILTLRGSALELKSSLGLTPVVFMDFAASEKQVSRNDPDYSVILVAARDQLNRLIVLDVWRKQLADYGLLARTLIQMHKLWRPQSVRGEMGALLNLFQPALRIQQGLMGTYFALHPLSHNNRDKVSRSMPLQGLMASGMVCIPEQATWTSDLLRELNGFPNTTHDDMCDALSYSAIDHGTLPRGTTSYVPPESELAQQNLERISRYEAIRREALNPSTYDPDAPDASWG